VGILKTVLFELADHELAGLPVVARAGPAAVVLVAEDHEVLHRLGAAVDLSENLLVYFLVGASHFVHRGLFLH
jgi:hypothetical protein